MRERLSAYRAEPRYVLLGEPGIGKSTAFTLEAEAVGTRPVRAHDFAAGVRPPGRTVFIDALEEYRIGEPGRDRLLTLIAALKASEYSSWRIACRAISLPPPDALRLGAELGDFAMLQLDLLEPKERRELLVAIGESNPDSFVDQVAMVGADPLLGNPATLLLLRDTFANSATPLDTRAALFGEATRQMSHEINAELPDRPNHPPPARIAAAAEAACLVLLLAVRSDLWLYPTLPPHPSVVTRDDLIEGRIDTEALRAAVDTAMFKGDAAGFQPTHRIVAEYLAGGALARAVAPPDPNTPALPLDRALALLTGDNDRPAPALTGIFAWFVSALARSPLSDRVPALLILDPEAVLFHGDAAALTAAQRMQLIDLVGHDDPWFLGKMRGSTAIGGLAGDDLVTPMRRILADSGETRHRRQMVLDALASGRRVAGLAPDVRAIITAPSTDHYLRRSALEAYIRIVGNSPAIVRALLDDMSDESFETASEVRAELGAILANAGALPADEARGLIEGYARTGDRVMGYARGLGEALACHPLPALFDAPIDVPDTRGIPRSFEARSLVNKVLAATIAATPALTANRLIDWLRHAGIDDDDRIEDVVKDAIVGWVDVTTDGERALFDAIQREIMAGSERLWRVDFDYSRLTGRDLSASLRRAMVTAAEVANDAELPDAARLAFYLVHPAEKHPELYQQLIEALRERPLAARWFASLTLSEIEPWREKRASAKRADRNETAAANLRDRTWLRERIAKLREGKLVHALGFASDVYHGHRRQGDETEGPARVRAWLGYDASLIEAVREGWDRHIAATLTTPRAEGQTSAFRHWPTAELMVLAWADWRWRQGQAIAFSLPLAFRMLRHAYALDANAQGLRELALERIYQDPDGTRALVAFWAGALRMRSQDLPQAQYLDATQPVVSDAVRQLLGERRKLNEKALATLLNLAAQCLEPDALLGLANKALARPQHREARRLWALVAFLLAPERHRELLASDLDGADGDAVFERLWDGRLGALLSLASAGIVARCEAMIIHLGQRHTPSRRSTSSVNRIGEVVGNTIALLSRQPGEDAAHAFDRLVALADLRPWKETLAHHGDAQRTLMRETRFTPPAPADVARALAAGPPATAADLRAVVRYTLEELVDDIRHGDTSPWRNFWNRPARGTPTPKIENDCRDLLTDRVRDRLRRYGIPVKRTGTETRSAADRRADMLVLGEGAAALPIEVKRHWNKELWTAVTDQLHPYTRSAGSNGHGIYLVLWFGTGSKRSLPPLPGGGQLPTTPGELKALLRARLAAEDRERIDIAVVDVSEPPARKGSGKQVARSTGKAKSSTAISKSK